MDREKVKRNLLIVLGEGRAKALTGKQLAYKCESDADGNDRHIRHLIRELIKEGYPIASTTKKPAGFFIAQNRQEVKDYAQVLRSRLIEDALRRRDFLRASRATLQPEQLVLV